MNHLEVALSGQRKSSIHVDIEIPDRTQNLDRTPNNPSEMNRRSEVNCPFTFYRKGSPRAKRRRESEKDDSDKKRTMRTFADPRENPTYEVESFALSRIIQNIKEKHIIELLDKFSPVIRAFPDQIKKEMLEFSFEWVNRKKILIEAINYVRYGIKDRHENEQKLRETNIEKLTEIFVIEIENRMPKFCQYCKLHYIVDTRDSPEIHCMWCRVGMHDCIGLNELKNRPGFKWICESCEPAFNIQYLAKLDPAVAIFEPVDSFEGFGEHTHPYSEIDETIHRNVGEEKDKEDEDEVEMVELNNPTPITLIPETDPKITTVKKHAYSCSRRDKVIERKEGKDDNDDEEERNAVRSVVISEEMVKEQEELNKIEVVAEIHNDGSNNRNHSYSGPQTGGNGILPNYGDVKQYPNLNKKKICYFLIKGICHFGARGENQYGKCDKYHPKHCRAYNLNGTMENGCKNGSKCKEWHATYICRSSANNRECTRPECPFKHHKNCHKQLNDNFLEHQNYPMMPRQYPVSNLLIASHSQHQKQHRHNRFRKNNHRQPPSHRQPHYHQSQAPSDHLVHMIRKIIREENQYQPRR